MRTRARRTVQSLALAAAAVFGASDVHAQGLGLEVRLGAEVPVGDFSDQNFSTGPSAGLAAVLPTTSRLSIAARGQVSRLELDAVFFADSPAGVPPLDEETPRFFGDLTVWRYMAELRVKLVAGPQWWGEASLGAGGATLHLSDFRLASDEPLPANRTEPSLAGGLAGGWEVSPAFRLFGAAEAWWIPVDGDPPTLIFEDDLWSLGFSVGARLRL